MIKDDKQLISVSNSGKLGCIDQLANFGMQVSFDDQVLYLDEADQSEIHRLMSSTLRNKRDAVLTNFTRLVKAARKIVLMSATISDAVIAFIAELRANPTTKIIKYENSFVHKQNFVVYENGENGNQGRSAVRRRILDHIEMLRLLYSGNLAGTSSYLQRGFQLSPFTICSDSQNECEKLEASAKAAGLKTKRIDSKNEDGDNELWLANLDGMVSENKIDVLIFSPSANSGVSCELTNYFSDIYCLYFGQIDVDSFLQMPVRVRDSSVIRHIGCNDYLPQSEDDDSVSADDSIIKNYVNEYAQNLGEMVLNGEIDKEGLRLQFEAFLEASTKDASTKRYCALKALQNYERSAMYDCIKERLTMLGHTFTSELQDGLSKEENELYRYEKDLVKRNESQKIASSNVITFEEAKALKDSGDINYPTALSVERAFIAEKVGNFTDLNEHYIYLIRYAKSNFIKGIESRFYADDLDYTKSITASKLKNTMDSSNALYLQDLLKNDYVRLRALVDIGVMDLIKGEDTELHGGHDAIANICKLAKKYRKKLGLTQGREESPMQFVSRLLDCFGYGFKVAGQITNEKGKKENRYRIICKGADTLVLTIAATYQISLRLAEEDKITTFSKAIAALGDLVPTKFKDMKLNKRNCTQKKYKALLMAVSSRIFNELQDAIQDRIEYQKTGQKTLFLSEESYTGKGMCKITTPPIVSLNK